MGYQALLFCPDEKSALTLTQVLSDLDFSVEACTETFAAVKKLMGQSFDAVVVDCENEQNASLLFKSARNSASNQAALAVAVVEGQGGVAKAFRIGANLVLTKPINVEQSKGTLRVARGLLRKNDPAKAASAAATTNAAPTPKPALTPKTIAPVKPAPLANTAAASASETGNSPANASATATKLSATASSEPVAQSETLPESVGEESPAITTTAQAVSHASGAASAPAPARISENPPAVEKPAEEPAAAQAPSEAAAAEPAKAVGTEPTFTFGGNVAADSSRGTSKKILLWPVVAILLAAAVYVGWTQYQGMIKPPATQQTPTHRATPPANNPAPPPLTSIPATPAPASTAPNTEAVPKPSPATSQLRPTTPPAAETDLSSQEPSTAVPSSGRNIVVTNLEQAPLPPRSVKTPVAAEPATPEAPAPSMVGMSAPGSETPMPKVVMPDDSALKPALQAVTVSQGVAQGLLIKKVTPVYPTNALRLRIEGKVELLATISKNGDVTHTQVLSGDVRLTAAATDAVRQWKYKPYLLNGEPVETQTQVTINFKLPQ